MGKGVATEAFPLNIGLVASFARKKFGNDIELFLFKYPDELRSAILERAPHILACSNYTWNFNLSYYFCRMAKALDRGILTVFGGTNYPFTQDQQQNFLVNHPALDLHIFYEG